MCTCSSSRSIARRGAAAAGRNGQTLMCAAGMLLCDATKVASSGDDRGGEARPMCGQPLRGRAAGFASSSLVEREAAQSGEDLVLARFGGLRGVVFLLQAILLGELETSLDRGEWMEDEANTQKCTDQHADRAPRSGIRRQSTHNQERPHHLSLPPQTDLLFVFGLSFLVRR